MKLAWSSKTRGMPMSHLRGGDVFEADGVIGIVVEPLYKGSVKAVLISVHGGATEKIFDSDSPCVKYPNATLILEPE